MSDGPQLSGEQTALVEQYFRSQFLSGRPEDAIWMALVIDGGRPAAVDGDGSTSTAMPTDDTDEFVRLCSVVGVSHRTAP